MLREPFQPFELFIVKPTPQNNSNAVYSSDKHLTIR
jgi:hypothetical protein